VEILWVAVLAFFQNVSFSIVSRSRNRDSIAYHLIASVGSNLIWFLTMRELVAASMGLALAGPYVAGTVAGSIAGVRVSMRIERWLGASSDGHLIRK
jgi:hypothetical protein